MAQLSVHDSSNNFPAPEASIQDLARIFNTALVATRVNTARDLSGELLALVESPAFKAILASVRQFATEQGVSEREAAESIVLTFRKVDRVWEDYILQEGVDRLKNQISG